MKKSLLLPATVLLVLVSTMFAVDSNLQVGPFDQHILTSQYNWGICPTTSCVAPAYVANYTTGQSSPSLDGDATKFFIGGTHSYTDVLWVKRMYRYETYNGSDIVENTHHFVYDAYFYVKNLSAMYGIELDINQFFGGHQYTWGHECISSRHEWDVWQASTTTPGKGSWIRTGVPCYPKAYYWNHVQLRGERTSNNQVRFVSVTLNGATYYFNHYSTRGPQSTSWHAITLNLQLDGNGAMTDYAVWVDKFNFYHWF